MITLFAFLAGLGSLAGTLVLVVGFTMANGAPQQAAMAALAIALAVLPYVLFRAIQVTLGAYRQRDFNAALLRKLDDLGNQKNRIDDQTSAP
ncbi:hypothetical protein QTI24_29365 [Variovorax sp. J22P240]|uniref:hypothetical protein n=1 Tax=Variovorax sp. J22P240 TaxID=3053514 RepID=UPI002574981C|nr:hypothetical protein [Variovorax sp. J22P240]MDM0002739.1 hypothetical protein [Variovorax sp. J22P240]